MTRFLTLLAVACWGLVAWGQQPALVGLPEYGVTLTGTPAQPTIANNSGKNLIGYVLRLEYASGGSNYVRNLNTHSLRLNVPALGLPDIGIPPGGTKTLEYLVSVAPGGVTSAPPVIVRVALDALIFPDGQFVGPDMGNNFEVLANQLIVEQELAQRVSAARNDSAKRATILAEVTGLAQPHRGPRPYDPEHRYSQMAQETLARDLVFVKNRAGEDAVFDVADRELAIPKLWRAQQ